LEIVVKDEAQMLRRKYPDIGKRGIGVGYPGGVNIAFDAEQLRLATIWRGRFVDPGSVWKGQGSGVVKALGKTIGFAKGPDLDDQLKPWVWTEEGRPDDHQFKGYSLDAKRQPTFQYEFDSVAATDFFEPIPAKDSNAGQGGQKTQLKRTVILTSAKQRQGLRFRLGTGKKIKQVSERVFAIDGKLQIRLEPGQQAKIADIGDGQSIELAMLVILKLLSLLTATVFLQQEPLGEYWGTAEEESKYYQLVDIPLPDELAVEAGSFEVMPDQKRLAIATRRGDIFLVDGAFDEHPEPKFHKFASGLDEVFGMAYRNGSFLITQQTEVTRITDDNGDDRADRFETLNDDWGFRNYHEFAFGSKPDPEGNIWVSLCLSKSYHSWVPFRGWCLKITPEGKAIPICSGIRSPCGIGPNETGEMFYAESQGPWNGSCSLKVLQPGGFMGHPVSFNWYELAPELGPAPVVPNTPSRLETERKRVEELVPYAVVFPYKRMGRSISGFQVDRTGGKFGVILRATTEKVNGVWQGACYPFREGFDTGLLAVQFTPDGNLIAGGTNRGWPVRGPKAYAVQRLDWTGKVPFEIKTVNADPKGFKITYQLKTFTHKYRQGYGSPEVDQTEPKVTRATVSDDGKSVKIEVDGLVQGHVHDFYLPNMRSTDEEKLLHANAYYTLNEIPVAETSATPTTQSTQQTQAQTTPTKQQHPVPANDQWLTYSGKSGPGTGKHVEDFVRTPWF